LVAFPPGSQGLRAKGIGRVVVDSMSDRPWSDYFLAARPTSTGNWMEKHPVATKRGAAGAVPGGPTRLPRTRSGRPGSWSTAASTDNYQYSVENLKEIPYDVLAGKYDPG